MGNEQPDLFSLEGRAPVKRPARHEPVSTSAEHLDDAAIIADILRAPMARCMVLVAEAGRRKLAAAVPVLVALCRRFAGYGTERTVPEQDAALRALAAIGGPDAARAVAEMIERVIVQGPGLRAAVAAAAELRSTLPFTVLEALLRSDVAGIRADACRCARPMPALPPLLAGLLHDSDPTVSASAACALARLGRHEALPALKTLLRKQPPIEAIDAVCAIADEECIDLLGKLARSTPALATAACDALEAIEHPRAGRILASLRPQR